MEYKKVLIENLSKNTIVYKNLKIVRTRNFALLLLLLILPIAVLSLTKYGSDKLIYEKVASLSNPIYSPYIDNSGISFVNTFGYEFENKSLEIGFPVITSNIINNGDSIDFTVEENNIIYSPESGIVSDVGTTSDGIKYIKILHSKNLESVISNVSISGVNIATVVNKGDNIATSNENNVVNYRIYDTGNLVTNLVIVNNVIEWQK